MGYPEELAKWRMQRKQAEIADRVQQIKDEYAQASRERDTLIANGQVEEAEWRDKDCEQLEAEYNEYCPPQQPQVDQRLAQFARRNSTFLERYGPRAYEVLAQAHDYMMRPRNPNSNNPAYTGMGWNPQAVFTPAYFDNLKSLLELHGESLFGVKYDRKEQQLTPNQAAKISGLSPNAYNNALRTVASQGRLGIKK